MALDLEFSDEQLMLGEMVRGVCSTYAPLDIVREMEDDAVGYPADLWKQFAELDLIGLLLPAEHGGSGMSMLEGIVVYKELGASLAPSPHFVSAVMAGGTIARAGSDAQRSEWLPAIASGSSVFSTAWLEPGNAFSPAGVQVRAKADGDGFVLAGTKWHVPYASSADRLLVLARTGDGDGDVDLFVIDPTADGVTLDQQLTIASDTQYSVMLEGVRVGTDAKIGDASTGWSTWNEAMLDGAILLAASAVGGARHALDVTVQYAKDRHQFDKPLGAFQAISHYLADATTAIDGAELLVHEAAWSRSVGRDVSSLAPMAKLFAAQTYRDVTAMAQQVFGGVGFTVEYEIQLYFRRAKQLQISWWDDRELEERIATALLD